MLGGLELVLLQKLMLVITNNIDRTKFEASGTATITLSATTKALLTAEEISQIEAMGYTLA